MVRSSSNSRAMDCFECNSRARVGFPRSRSRFFLARADGEREKKFGFWALFFAPLARKSARKIFSLPGSLRDVLERERVVWTARGWEICERCFTIQRAIGLGVWYFASGRFRRRDVRAFLPLVFSRSPNLCLFVVFLPRRVPKHSR